MHISNILSNSCKLDYTRLKFNLAYKIIYEGKKLGFSFKESSFEIGKVIKKEHKHFITEHWQIEANNDIGNMLARKCNGCTLGRCNDTSYIIRQKQKIWHQVL